jgi:carbon storage regulator
MLVLTRKCGETIRIGDNVTVTVLRVNAGSVRLGIAAPSDVAIHREEVYDKIHGDETAPEDNLGNTIQPPPPAPEPRRRAKYGEGRPAPEV